MKSLSLTKFLIKHLNLLDVLKIVFNFFLNLVVIFLEILFITLVYLFISPENDVSNKSFLIEHLINYIDDFSISYSLTLVQAKVILITISVISKNVVLILQNWFLSDFIFKLLEKKNAEVFENYLKKDYLDFIKKDISYYTKNLNKEVYHVFSGVLQSLVQIFNDTIYVILILVFSLELLNLHYSFYHLVILFILIIFISFIFKKTKEIGKIRFNEETNVFKNVNNFFSSIKEVKIYGAYDALISNFKDNIKKYYQTFIYGSVFSVAPKLILEVFVLLAFYISFSYSTESIETFIPSIAVIVVLVLRILPPIHRSIANYSSIIFYKSSVKEIDMSYNKKFKPINNIKKIKKKIKTIELKNIFFSFKGKKNRNVLDNLNFKFEKGNIYGIFGESGRGKTTLLTIISGLIKPDKGKIIINNKIASNKDIYSSYDVGFLSQNPFILNENLLTNITLKFNHDKSEIYKIKENLKKLNLSKFTNHKYLFKNNFTFGDNLSGGEKQRIALLRTIFRNNSLILLDEPTSALDSKNENLVIKLLKKISKDKVIIISTHKTKLMKYFNKTINLI